MAAWPRGRLPRIEQVPRDIRRRLVVRKVPNARKSDHVEQASQRVQRFELARVQPLLPPHSATPRCVRAPPLHTCATWYERRSRTIQLSAAGANTCRLRLTIAAVTVPH